MPLKNSRYTGNLYRALNPFYARDPLSGSGAERYGGRFNSKGTAALYLSMDPTFALREANQVGDLQPLSLVAFRANVGPIFDTRDTALLKQYGMTEQKLSYPAWRSGSLDRRSVTTQRFAEELVSLNFSGLLVRSFARGATGTSLNLVLWQWVGKGTKLEVIDDEVGLTRSRLGS